MARSLVLLLLALFSSACASGPRCPFGTAAVPARAAQIRQLLAQTSAKSLLDASPLPICFDTTTEHGQLLSRDGVRAVLSESRDDRELAAELAHVLVHYADRLGDGCARGLQAALDSETRAEQLENHVRAELSVPTAIFSDAARDDYRRRCKP